MTRLTLAILPFLLLTQNTTTAQAPPKKPAAAPAAAPAAKTTSLKDAKFAAIEAWLNANKASPDRADGLCEAADLAFELSSWPKAKTLAETYGKEFPKGEKAGEMHLLVGRALANIPGSEAEAKKVFAKAAEDAGEDVNAVVNATSELASLQLNMGDKDGAKKTLEDLADKFGKVRGLKEFVNGKIEELDSIGTEPKPIDVQGFDGKPVKLADFKGKVLLIDFWATWCGPCVAELPNVIATYKKYHGQGFEILGISLDEDEAKLKDFLASHEMPWAQFFDGKLWKNEIAVAYGVNSIPRTYLLDRDGKIHRLGLRGPALPREVEKLLAAKAPAPKKVGFVRIDKPMHEVPIGFDLGWPLLYEAEATDTGKQLYFSISR
jgi:thiol-disulfide isomerase/thioredoxin